MKTYNIKKFQFYIFNDKCWWDLTSGFNFDVFDFLGRAKFNHEQLFDSGVVVDSLTLPFFSFVDMS